MAEPAEASHSIESTVAALPAGPAFAALDLGTSNCRLLVAAPNGAGFRVLDSFSRVVRLGEGLHQTGELGAAAMERTLAALQTCAERLARRPVREIRAIATEACRRAANGRAFLDRVRQDTGLDFDVISTRQEAELALDSCAPLLNALSCQGFRRALLLDIGGGSTELAWVRLQQARHDGGPRLIGTVSLPVGVIDVGEAWGGGSIGPDGFEATVQTIACALQPFEAVHCIAQEIRHGGVAMLGTSGTVTTLAGVALELPRYRRHFVDGVMLDTAAAQAAVQRLRAMSEAARAAHPCVGPERVSFVLPGCAVFAAIHRVWPAPRIMVADRGLREGMLLRMMRSDAAKRTDRQAAADRRPSAALPP